MGKGKPEPSAPVSSKVFLASAKLLIPPLAKIIPLK
jgi:hypothetical protein